MRSETSSGEVREGILEDVKPKFRGGQAKNKTQAGKKYSRGRSIHRQDIKSVFGSSAICLNMWDQKILMGLLCHDKEFGLYLECQDWFECNQQGQ